MNLPKSVLAWTRSDRPKEANGTTIFDYMDGAGELYVGYRFDHLEAYTYQSSQAEEILVELYRMKSSDDAFGLLSLDWTGEPVELNHSPVPKNEVSIIPAKRFLYGAGLLRIWSDDVFARIAADRETPESKEAVMTLGRSIVSGRKNTGPPVFLNLLPSSFPGGWQIEPDEVRFLRSYLVFNSIYFLSFSNILDLDLSCRIASARYRSVSDTATSKPFRVFIIHYIDADKAWRALIHFHKAYFPEIPVDQDKGLALFKPQVYLTENTWNGYALHNWYVALGFGLPDRSTGEQILHELVNHIKRMEGSNGRQ